MQNTHPLAIPCNALAWHLVGHPLKALYTKIAELEHQIDSLEQKTVEALEMELLIKKDEDGMKRLTLLPTAKLFELAKMPGNDSIYEYLLETSSQAQAQFASVAHSDGNFAAFERFCDSMMTREHAIDFLCDTGRFRNMVAV